LSGAHKIFITRRRSNKIVHALISRPLSRFTPFSLKGIAPFPFHSFRLSLSLSTSLPPTAAFSLVTVTLHKPAAVAVRHTEERDGKRGSGWQVEECHRAASLNETHTTKSCYRIIYPQHRELIYMLSRDFFMTKTNRAAYRPLTRR